MHSGKFNKIMGKFLVGLPIDKLLGKMVEYRVSAKTERTGQVRAAKKCRMMLLILHIWRGEGD